MSGAPSRYAQPVAIGVLEIALTPSKAVFIHGDAANSRETASTSSSAEKRVKPACEHVRWSSLERPRLP